MYSKSENSVIHYLLQGLSNKEIGERLFVTDKSVKFHITNIYRKASVKSRGEFIAKFRDKSDTEDWRNKTVTNPEVVMTMPQGANPVIPTKNLNVPAKTQEQKVQFIDETFRVGETITHLHHMMKEVTSKEFSPNTVNAACNCVARLNETINTAIQAAKFLNER